jgi:flagella synthesis protein FlgN
MDQPNDPNAEFSEILRIESEQTERLLELLRQEHQLLLQPPSSALEELTAVKQQQLEQLEQTVQRQTRLLARLGLSPDRQGAEAFIASLPAPSPLHTQWLNLEEMLEASRKQNEINGGIVALSRRQISNALDLLQSTRQGQKTYDRSGESRTSRPSNSFGTA